MDRDFLLENLRAVESGKFRCEREHFKTLATGANPARYVVATSLDDVLR